MEVRAILGLVSHFLQFNSFNPSRDCMPTNFVLRTFGVTAKLINNLIIQLKFKLANAIFSTKSIRISKLTC